MSVGFQPIPAVPVVLRHIAQTQDGAIVFLAAKEKTFSIQVDRAASSALGMAVTGKRAPRPLPHDLLELVLAGLEVAVERVIIRDVADGVFFSTVTLKMRNELGTKIINVDARPSDAFVLALRKKCQIFTACSVLEKVMDVSAQLEALLKGNPAGK
jgi:bifunctional DNase/RNase